MRVVFLGTPDFAVPSLNALALQHQVAAVLTQPDRPKGRGNQLSKSPVKMAAEALHVPVHQPERIRRPENVALLKSFEADLMVVVGYGQIIPQDVIDLPRHGILNVHASLLPRYRGAAPIQWAIAKGETVTGVTIMQIDAGLDTGDMLLKAETEIGTDETAPELSARLAPLGADLLLKAIDLVAAGASTPEKQDDAEAASYAPILKKEDGMVDWSRSAREIRNRLRGFTPWPGAYTMFRGQQLNIVGAAAVDYAGIEIGAMALKHRSIVVGCGDGSALQLIEVQPAGKKRMSVEAFVNGYKPLEGERLGEPN